MSRMFRVFMVLAVLVGLLGVRRGMAQGTRVTVGAGVGGTVPVGDLNDVAGIGYNAQGNLGLSNPGWPVRLRFDGIFHSLPGDHFSADRSLFAGLVNVQLPVWSARRGGGLYVAGGGGLYRTDTKGGAVATDPGILAGAGYEYAMESLSVSLEARFNHVFTEGSASQLTPIDLVVTVPVSAGRGAVAARR